MMSTQYEVRMAYPEEYYWVAAGVTLEKMSVWMNTQVDCENIHTLEACSQRHQNILSTVHNTHYTNPGLI